MVIARLLGVMQYGVVVGAFALVNLVAQYSRLGTGTVLIRYVAPQHRRCGVYWGNSLLVTLVLGGGVILLLTAIAPQVIDPASAAIIAFMAVGSCVCEQLTISATQVFSALQNMRTVAWLAQLTSMFRTVTAIGLLVTLHHATARQWAIASMLASAAAAAVCIGVVTVRVGWPQFAPHLAWKHGAEGVGYAFASSTVSAYDDLDKTMLSHYRMNEANGVYGMAYRAIDMGTLPVAAILLAAEPRLFQLAADGVEHAISLGDRLLKRTLLVSAASAVGLFVLAPLIPLIAGEGFAGTVSALRWLCIIPFFRSIHWTTGSVLTSIGLQRYRTLAQIAVVILNFCLNLWLIPRFGWHGAAWASLVTDGTLALLDWCIVERVRRSLKSAEMESICS
jgi:O-antigen/teichoic acid export membrane protein